MKQSLRSCSEPLPPAVLFIQVGESEIHHLLWSTYKPTARHQHHRSVAIRKIELLEKQQVRKGESEARPRPSVDYIQVERFWYLRSNGETSCYLLEQSFDGPSRSTKSHKFFTKPRCPKLVWVSFRVFPGSFAAALLRCNLCNRWINSSTGHPRFDI